MASSVAYPLEVDKTLAGELYRSCEIFNVEVERIFGKLWLCVGHEREAAAPGDYFTRQLGPESILVIRGRDGEARAFYNVCRHRGSRLVLEDEGRGAKRLQCPYHAWAYGLDGELVSAPLMESTPCFERGDYPLVGVRLESSMGFLFVNLDDGAAPLGCQLEGFPDLSRFGLGELRRVERKVYDVDANWKLLGENYGECYHCALAHPHLNRVSDYRNVGHSVSGPFWNGGPMKLNEGCNTKTMSGRTERPMLTGHADDHQWAHYYHLYPAFLLSIMPDFALTHTLWPVGATRTRVICDWHFPENTVARAGFDPSDAVEFWDLTNRQDWQLCERVQLGVQSRGHRQGPFNELEVCVRSFDEWYLAHMQDGLP